MSKKINFSISETTVRTFEMDLKDIQQLHSKIEGVSDDLSTSSMIRNIISEYGFDEISMFEKNNSYYETNIEKVNEVI